MSLSPASDKDNVETMSRFTSGVGFLRSKGCCSIFAPPRTPQPVPMRTRPGWLPEAGGGLTAEHSPDPTVALAATPASPSCASTGLRAVTKTSG